MGWRERQSRRRLLPERLSRRRHRDWVWRGRHCGGGSISSCRRRSSGIPTPATTHNKAGHDPTGAQTVHPAAGIIRIRVHSCASSRTLLCCMLCKGHADEWQSACHDSYLDAHLSTTVPPHVARRIRLCLIYEIMWHIQGRYDTSILDNALECDSQLIYHSTCA